MGSRLYNQIFFFWFVCLILLSLPASSETPARFTLVQMQLRSSVTLQQRQAVIDFVSRSPATLTPQELRESYLANFPLDVHKEQTLWTLVALNYCDKRETTLRAYRYRQKLLRDAISEIESYLEEVQFYLEQCDPSEIIHHAPPLEIGPVEFPIEIRRSIQSFHVTRDLPWVTPQTPFSHLQQLDTVSQGDILLLQRRREKARKLEYSYRAEQKEWKLYLEKLIQPHLIRPLPWDLRR